MLADFYRNRRDKIAMRLADLVARTPEQAEELRVVRLRLGQLEKAYATKRETFAAAIDRVEPDIVIVLEDVVGPDTSVMIRAAHEKNRAAVILPYTIADQSEAAEALAANPRFHLFRHFNWLGLFWSWKYIRRHKGTWLLRLPFPMARAHILAGLTPPDPWLMNTGAADAIALESERMRDYYLEHDFQPEQLRVVGSAYEDEMFRLQRDRDRHYRELCAAEGLDPEKPLLVFSAPPNQLISGVDNGDYDDFAKMCADLAETLKQRAKSHNILVCMHPNFRDQAFHFSDRGLAIYEGDMMHIVPLARVFVAFASATLRWAIAMGVPAINYDIFRYGYTEFDSAGGVLRVDDMASFDGQLDRLCNDAPFFAEISERQESARAYWSMSDGRSVARIRALVEEMIRRRDPDGQAKPEGRSLRALHLVLRSSDCAEARRSAVALKADAQIESVFLFSTARTPDTELFRRDVELCREAGIECLTLAGEPFAYGAEIESGTP